VRVKEGDLWQTTTLTASLTAILIVKVALEFLWVKVEAIVKQVSAAVLLEAKAVSKGLLTMNTHGSHLEVMPRGV